MREGGQRREGSEPGREGSGRKELLYKNRNLLRARDIHLQDNSDKIYVSTAKVLQTGKDFWAPAAEVMNYVAESSAHDTAAMPASLRRSRTVGDEQTPIDRVFVYNGTIRRETIDAQIDAFHKTPNIHGPNKEKAGLQSIYYGYQTEVALGHDLLSDREARDYLKEVRDDLRKGAQWPENFILPQKEGEKGQPTEETVHLFDHLVHLLAGRSKEAYLYSSWTDMGGKYDLRTLIRENESDIEVCNTALIGVQEPEIEGAAPTRTKYWKYHQIGNPYYIEELSTGPTISMDEQIAEMLPDRRFDFEKYLDEEPVVRWGSMKASWEVLESRYRQLVTPQNSEDIHDIWNEEK